MGHRPPRPAGDPSPADWLLPRMADFGFGARVTDVVPSGFEAYARLFHPADRGGSAVRWSDVAAENGRVMHSSAQFYGIAPSVWQRSISYPEDLHAPVLGQLPKAVLGSVVAALRPHTDLTADCFFAIWEGYGDLETDSGSYQASAFGEGSVGLPVAVEPGSQLDVASAPRVVHPHRTYFLFTGGLDEVGDARTGNVVGWMDLRPPNLMWPADDSWCLGSEIDFDSTLIGGSRALIRDVLVQPGIEALEIQPGESLHWGGDTINAMPDYFDR